MKRKDSGVSRVLARVYPLSSVAPYIPGIPPSKGDDLGMKVCWPLGWNAKFPQVRISASKFRKLEDRTRSDSILRFTSEYGCGVSIPDSSFLHNSRFASPWPMAHRTILSLTDLRPSLDARPTSFDQRGPEARKLVAPKSLAMSETVTSAIERTCFCPRLGMSSGKVTLPSNSQHLRMSTCRGVPTNSHPPAQASPQYLGNMTVCCKLAFCREKKKKAVSDNPGSLLTYPDRLQFHDLQSFELP